MVKEKFVFYFKLFFLLSIHHKYDACRCKRRYQVAQANKKKPCCSGDVKCCNIIFFHYRYLSFCNQKFYENNSKLHDKNEFVCRFLLESRPL